MNTPMLAAMVANLFLHFPQLLLYLILPARLILPLTQIYLNICLEVHLSHHILTAIHTTLLGLVEAIVVVDLIVEKEIIETNIMDGVNIMEVMVVLNIMALNLLHFQLVDFSFPMADNLFTLAFFKILMVDNFLHFNLVYYSFIMVDNFLTLVVIKVLMMVPLSFLMEKDLFSHGGGSYYYVPPHNGQGVLGPTAPPYLAPPPSPLVSSVLTSSSSTIPC
ncbi:hypothetical protein ACFX2I_013315 [Malus domestica]